MWAVFLKMLGFLVPPDPCPWELLPGAQSPKEAEEVRRNMRRWLLGISGAMILVLIVLIASATTPYGFALAGDTQAQTKTEVKPLQESVQNIQAELRLNKTANLEMMAALNELRAVAVANGIDRLIRRRCIETDIDELQQLRRDIDGQKRAFFDLARREYDEPSCTEVRR